LGNVDGGVAHKLDSFSAVLNAGFGLLAEVWKTGFGQWAELLSFAWPKESGQRKGIFCA
jgi:hypothetical protein